MKLIKKFGNHKFLLGNKFDDLLLLRIVLRYTNRTYLLFFSIIRIIAQNSLEERSEGEQPTKQTEKLQVHIARTQKHRTRKHDKNTTEKTNRSKPRAKVVA